MLRKYKFILIVTVLLLGLCLTNFGFAQDKTVVEIWECNSPEARASLFGTIAEFEHYNPDIKIDCRTVSFGTNFEKVMIAVAAGTPPDTTATWGAVVPQFAEMDALESLDEYGAEEFKDQVYPASWDYGIYRGKIWALPDAVDPRFIAYDMHMFEEAGIKKVPETWEEFRDVAMKTTNVAKGVHGFGAPVGTPMESAVTFMPWLWTNGGDIFSEDLTECTLDSKEALEALEFLANMAKDGYFLPVVAAGGLNARNLFIMGRLAMLDDGPWIIKQMTTRAPDKKYGRDWGIFSIPVPKVGMKRVNLATVGADVMYKAHKAPGEAVYRVIAGIAPSRATGIYNMLCGKTTVRYDTLDEYIIKFLFPSEIPQPILDIQKQLTEHTRTLPNHHLWSQMEEAFQLKYDLVLTGELSPTEGLKAITDDIDFLLK